MIYFCADDYGLCDSVNLHIQQCVDGGALNKVSVFPNFDAVDLRKFNPDTRISLHLNLVEGKCLSKAEEIDLLADKNGNFKHTFFGLFKLWLFQPKKLEAQLYKEIKLQVLYWRRALPEGADFCIDSHQHTHMLPPVFNALLQVLKDEKMNIEYMRIPAEPILPYLKAPSLYFTYRPVNLIKQWFLKFLWLCNKRKAKHIKKAYFMGILFSGKMDEKRVLKILPAYEKLARKTGADIEVLFHPGFIEQEKEIENIVFPKFYFSENRKTEFDSVKKIAERSV